MNPTVQAAIDAITKVDTDLTAANTALQTATELHTQDQQTIQDLQAKLAKAQQPAPTAPTQALSIPKCFDLDFDYGLKAAPGSVAVTGATGSVTGTYTRNINADGTNVWQYTPKHKPGESWDAKFFNRSFPYDPTRKGFIFKIAWRFPTPLDFDRCEQLETNCENQLADFSTQNWGFGQNVGGSDGFKWFDFLKREWVQLDIPYTKYATDMRAGKVLQISELLYLDRDNNSVFDSVVLNGTQYPVRKVNPPVTRDNRKAEKWSPFFQWAWQADAKGQDQPFTVITYGMSVVAY